MRGACAKGKPAGGGMHVAETADYALYIRRIMQSDLGRSEVRGVNWIATLRVLGTQYTRPRLTFFSVPARPPGVIMYCSECRWSGDTTLPALVPV